MTNKSFALSIQNLYYDETPFLSIVCRLVVVDVGNTFGVGVEIAGITVSKIIVKWFKGKEMALAMGLEMACGDVFYF